MLICMKHFYFTYKLLKSMFMENVKCRKSLGFGMLHQKYINYRIDAVCNLIREYLDNSYKLNGDFRWFKCRS